MTLTQNEMQAALAEIREQARAIDAACATWLARLTAGTVPPAVPPGASAWVWPTDYRVVTQRYGANKPYYAKLGLPGGHEGVDIRALTGTEIYAAHAGRVSRVDQQHPAYGVSVRVTFTEDGHQFELTVAHGQKGSVRVKVGDDVEAGAVLMRADATGNVIGGASHLHHNIKVDGVLVDPMIYLGTLPGVTYL